MTDRGVLDTSVFIASESGRPLKEDLLPEAAAVDVLNDVEILPLDADVALIWAQLRVALAESGRRINANELWIAATAARHRLPVVSRAPVSRGHDQEASAAPRRRKSSTASGPSSSASRRAAPNGAFQKSPVRGRCGPTYA